MHRIAGQNGEWPGQDGEVRVPQRPYYLPRVLALTSAAIDTPKQARRSSTSSRQG